MCTMTLVLSITDSFSQLKDVESKLQVSEESAKQAHDLMRYMLQERPNLDESIAECLNEYMKGM